MTARTAWDVPHLRLWLRKRWIATDRNDRLGITEYDSRRRFYTEWGARKWADYMNERSYGAIHGWVSSYRRLP